MEYLNYYETKLYPIQNEVLKNLKSLNLPFYLTGGTAVKIESLHLRYSHDLNLFVNRDSNFLSHVEQILKARHQLILEHSYNKLIERERHKNILQ